MSAAVHPSRVSAPRCIDCTHSRRLAFLTKLYCDHPSTPVDPRDGSPQISAIDMRDGPGYLARLGVLQPCGPAGTLFVARDAAGHVIDGAAHRVEQATDVVLQHIAGEPGGTRLDVGADQHGVRAGEAVAKALVDGGHGHV